MREHSILVTTMVSRRKLVWLPPLVWSKKTKLMSENITSWRNISISIFKLSPFFIYNESLLMKSCQFFKFTNPLIRKEKKHSHSSQSEKKSWEKLALFYNRLFYKDLLIIIHISFILQAHSQYNFRSLIWRWREKYQKRSLGTANS